MIIQEAIQLLAAIAPTVFAEVLKSIQQFLLLGSSDTHAKVIKKDAFSKPVHLIPDPPIPGNGKVHCVCCNNHVFPRMVTYRGVPENSYCPICAALITRFSESFGSFLSRELYAVLSFVFTRAKKHLKQLFSEK